MATATRNDNSVGGWVFAVLGVALLLLLLGGALAGAVGTDAIPLPQEAPPREGVIYRPHAVEKHGDDALAARTAVKGCQDPQSRWIDGKTGEGLGWAVWCETGGPLCPGMYITAGNVEKTALVRPCSEWRTGRRKGEW